MATKKQKRLAGEAKQAINRAESIRSGLAAQERDHKRRASKQEDAKREAQRMENRLAVAKMHKASE